MRATRASSEISENGIPGTRHRSMGTRLNRIYARRAARGCWRSTNSGWIVREQDGGDLPPVPGLDEMQPETAAALLPLVHENESGADARNPIRLVDPHILQALADSATGLEVILLRLEELLQTAHLDSAV